MPVGQTFGFVEVLAEDLVGAGEEAEADSFWGGKSEVNEQLKKGWIVCQEVTEQVHWVKDQVRVREKDWGVVKAEAE
jgi:hypothetical protein